MNQVKDNPFPYSDTNKRYHTISYALKRQFSQKAAKIPLNAGFSCPNRDGTKSTGGCRFCSSSGSGESILEFASSLPQQYASNLERARRKWPDALGIPYFQAYSNTYAPLETLQQVYQPFLDDPKIPMICIATRTDCFEEETARWLSSSDTEVWMEFGLQTIHETTAKAMNLCHSAQDAVNAVELCRKYGLKSCLHLINGLPGETKEMMLETAAFAAKLHPAAIKIHMLHLLDDSKLGKEYLKAPFELLSLEEYMEIVCDQLEILPADIIIERITGDGLADHLIGPDWTRNKTNAANTLDKMMAAKNTWQGRYAYPFDPRPAKIDSFELSGFQAEFYKGLPFECMRLRADIFLKEQGFTMEFDEEDEQCIHLLIKDGTRALGSARVMPRENGTWQIGRIVVSKAARGRHLGLLLLEACELFLKKQGAQKLVLHAQCRVIPFYEKAGFVPYGPTDYDEHVLHQWMKKEI